MCRHSRYEAAEAAEPFWAGPGRCHSFARFGGRRGHFERFFAAGGGRERFFDAGDLQLIVLSLLADKPSYGYELIKAIEERMGGGYSPSPGVIYPTLTLLEERGLARVESSEGSRKVYAITDAGRAELAAHAERLGDLTGRFAENRERSEPGRSMRIRRAFLELRQSVFRCAVRHREVGKPFTEEEISKIVEAIQQAVRAIDAV